MFKNKFNLRKVVATETCLAVTAVVTSCKKINGDDDDGNTGNGKVKLLETMTNSDGDSYKFAYDEQNRISKIFEYYEGSLSNTKPLIYSGNNLVELGFVPRNTISSYWTYEYTKSGNTITITETNWLISSGSIVHTNIVTLTLNSDGLPVKEVSDSGETTFQYDRNGNIMKRLSDSGTDEMKYDDKKSPFYNCKTPKWWLQSNYLGSVGIHHNITEYAWMDDEGYNGKTTYTYVYDSDGFPAQATVIVYDDKGVKSNEWEAMYTYIEK